MEQDRYLWVIQAHTTENGAQMLDEWNRDLARLLLQTTLLALDMIAASGRDDGRRLESEATTVVDALFQLRLVAAIRAAGGRLGAEVLLRDLPEVSPALSEGLDCFSTVVTAPDKGAQSWLRENGGLLERAFNSARVAHMAGTAMKMNAIENFAEFQYMAGLPNLRDFAGTSEDIAICLLSAKARGADRQRPSI